MKKIMLIISIILIFCIILNINGCVPEEETQDEEDELTGLATLEDDLNPDNLGDIDKEIDEAISW